MGRAKLQEAAKILLEKNESNWLNIPKKHQAPDLHTLAKIQRLQHLEKYLEDLRQQVTSKPDLKTKIYSVIEK